MRVEFQRPVETSAAVDGGTSRILLSKCKCKELLVAVAIYEYKDVFSSDPVNMRQTDLLTLH